jgi:peptide-methionine (R)-S-oxide reductase
MMADLAKSPKDMTEADWKAVLEPKAYHVLRQKGTEPARTGEYDKFYPTEGHFVCGGCKTPLYSAEAKFKSGCGWPAFDKCYKGAVTTVTDTSYGIKRVEILCAACNGHLGHVFEGEHMTPTNERHCVNSVGLSRPIFVSLSL